MSKSESVSNKNHNNDADKICETYDIPKTMKAVVVDSSTKKLIINSNVQTPSLQSQEVLIRVYACGVNRADLLQAAGKYPPPPGASDIIGLEVSGVIVAMHKDCKKTQTLKIGDKVMALLAGGGYAEYVNVHEAVIMPIPHIKDNSEHPELITAAAIPEVFLTAYQILFWYGLKNNIDERSDERKVDHNTSTHGRAKVVLVHAAASGVGTTLLQYCHKFGLHAYVTAGSQDKIESCVKLGAKGGANYKTQDFSKELLKMYPKGADVILDCVGQSHFHQNKESIAEDGRWVIYGTLSGSVLHAEKDSTLLDLSFILRKRVSIIGTTLRARDYSYKQRLIEDFQRDIIPLLENGQIKPIICKVFAITEAQKAHEFVNNSENIGKVILKW